MTYSTRSVSEHSGSFQADGFCCNRGALASWHVNDLREMAEAGIAEAATKAKLPLDTLERLVSAWGNQSTIVEAMVTSAMLRLNAVASSIAEIDPQPVDATLFVKSPYARSATHAHQDIAYRWNREPESRYGLTTWLALDDVCSDNGGVLSFLPGSHRGEISVRQDFLASDFRDYAASDEWLQRAITVPVAAGDVVVFDAQTWHSADAFKGQCARRALAVRWSYADKSERKLEIPVPQVDSNCFGMETSGRLLLDAVFRAYPSLPTFDCADTLAEKIEAILDWCRLKNEAMPQFVKQVLEDLATALKLESTHGARTNPDLWLDVRDQVIPALNFRFD